MAARASCGGLPGTEFRHRARVDRASLLFAARQPELRAVVSLAAFAHPAAMMRRWLATLHIAYWPLGAYILAYVQHVTGFHFDAIAPRNSIAGVA